MCFTCLLIPILTGLICALLGYLLGRLLCKKSSNTQLATGPATGVAAPVSVDYSAELNACRAKSAELQAKLDALTREHSNLKMSMTAPTVALLPFDAEMAASVFGKKIAQDDLKLVEGIGPKIEELFHAAGIKTWKALSETSVEKCREILQNGGDRFAMHEPATWPRQCQMMYEGKWQELKDWQDTLDGGKE